MQLTVTDFVAALKKVFTKKEIERLSLIDSPFLARVSKKDELYGEGIKVPMILSQPAGISTSFTSAQSNKAAGRYKNWDITRSQLNGVISVDYEAILASSKDFGAFLKAKTAELEGITKALGMQLEQFLFGSGSGSISRVDSSTNLSGNVLKLTSVDDVLKVALDRVLVFSATNGTGTVKAGSVKVTAINHDTAEITVNANLSTAVPTIAASDYIFFDGDYANALVGLAGWLPDTAPTSGDDFFGVDRSVDSTRLAGHRINGVGRAIEEIIIEATNKVARYGGRSDVLWVSYKELNNIQMALGSKAQYVEFKKGEIMFAGVRINGPKGQIEVYASPYCPDNRMYLLDMSTVVLYTMGDAPHLIDADGNKMLRESNQNAFEMRQIAYTQLCFSNPGANAVILR